MPTIRTGIPVGLTWPSHAGFLEDRECNGQSTQQGAVHRCTIISKTRQENCEIDDGVMRFPWMLMGDCLAGNRMTKYDKQYLIHFSMI